MRTITSLIALVVSVLAFTCPARATLSLSDVVAWYQLNGDATDSSGNSFNGTNNGATFVSDPTRGTVASFNGSSSSIDVSASGYSVTEHPNLQFSTSFWIKPTPRQDFVPGGAVDVNPIMGGTGPTRGVIEVVGDGSWGGMGGSSAFGGVGVNSGGGAGSTGRVNSVDLYDGGWHHVLMQWVDPDGSIAGNTGADATVYIDGMLAADANSQTYNGNNGNTNPPQFVLGGPVVFSNGGPQDKFYDGLMSDVLFFNRQLTAAEVPEAMNFSVAPPQVTLPDPLLHWKLDESQGPGVREEVTGLSNVATAIGPVAFGQPGLAPDGGSAIRVASGAAPDYIDAGTIRGDGVYVPGADPSFTTLHDQFTVTGWVNLASQGGQDGVIFSSNFTSNDGFLLFTRDTGGVDNNLGVDFGNERRLSNIGLNLDQDYFVALVFDDSDSGSEGEFAVWDGTNWLFADAQTNRNAFRLQGLEIGSFNDGTRPFDGVIDDVRLFDTALTREQLNLLINPPVTAGVPEPATALLGLLGLAMLGRRRRREG